MRRKKLPPGKLYLPDRSLYFSLFCSDGKTIAISVNDHHTACMDVSAKNISCRHSLHILLKESLQRTMYEKNGQPLEVILKQMIETKFIRPKNRPYQTNNFYEALARQRDLEMEVKRIVQNRKNGGKGKTHRQREKGRG